MKEHQRAEIQVHKLEGMIAMTEVLQLLTWKGIHVEGWSRFQSKGEPVLLLTTNEPQRARRLLNDAGFQCDRAKRLQPDNDL